MTDPKGPNTKGTLILVFGSVLLFLLGIFIGLRIK